MLTRALCLLFCFVGTQASAQVCGELDERTRASALNGQLFYKTVNAWVPFQFLSQLPLAADQKINVLYIVRADSRGDRSGALVVKSGVYAPSPSGVIPDRVELMRREAIDDDVCRTKEFGGARVSGKGYEDYHEYGLTTTPELKADFKKDLTAIERFHARYSIGNKRCFETNDFRKGELTSDHNASQFSFSKSVVDDGPGKGVKISFFGSPAIAAPLFASRRAEIRHYRTDGGLQCVPFVVTAAPGERSFLRINDLEGLVQPPSRVRQKELRLDN